jgi:predicted nucleotidyltransferase
MNIHPNTNPNPSAGRAGLAGTLFAKVQLRILALLFGQPDRSFYASELIKLAKSGTGAVRRELERLERAGLVSATWVGNQKHYQANRDSPIFAELHGIVIKTVGLVEPIRDALESCADKIMTAFVYESVAKGEDTAKSDVDLMIVGDDLTYSDIYARLQSAEIVLGRSINPNFMHPGEWNRRLNDPANPFVAKISAQPKLFVLGSEESLKT